MQELLKLFFKNYKNVKLIQMEKKVEEESGSRSFLVTDPWKSK